MCYNISLSNTPKVIIDYLQDIVTDSHFEWDADTAVQVTAQSYMQYPMNTGKARGGRTKCPI